MATELKSKKQRPKTHRSRSRNRQVRVVKPRPTTTRINAPISYTDLELMRDPSSTSNEGSPIRSGFGARANRNIYFDAHPEQYSLLAIQSSKFNNLEFGDVKPAKSSKSLGDDRSSTLKFSDTAPTTVPTKPSLSIIDFNQLTRGGLEQAKRSESQSRTRQKGKN